MTPFTVTFYSFKGGVGRTVLAANIAALLARSGKTLLWDLDIEAPGLHRIADLASSKLNQAGFFEWLLAWQEQRQFDPPTARDHQCLAECLLPVDAQRQLSILPAHGDEANFAALYQKIDWQRFLASEPERGRQLFRGLIAYFGEQGFRHIVLDSRTGITDIGGFLAALLPHVTVMVGNYGVQNTAGLKAIWQALRLQTEGRDPDREPLPPLRLELVASPIPIDDPVQEIELREVWSRHFGLSANNVIHIPESSILRRSERILVLHEAQSEIVDRYAALAQRLQAVDAERQAEEAGAQRASDERPDLAGGPRRSRTAQGKRFEERIADLLRLLGYRVESEQTVDGVKVDLIATMSKGLDETVYFVECKDHAAAVGTDVATTLGVWLGTSKAKALGARGMIVARRFSPQAIEYAKSNHIRVFTPEDLERALLDFKPYLGRLVSEFAASPLADCYVEQNVSLEKTSNEARPLLPHAVAWASGEGSRLWVLLGDYGTGKTAFTRRFAYDLAQRALGSPDAPVPLLINLRDFPNKTSLGDVLHEHWAARTGERRDPQIFLHLLQRGRAVLLLDSFDEMGVAQAHRNVVEQFRSLVHPTGAAGDTARANRILITCRDQYFRDKSEAEQATAGRSDSLEKATRGFDGTIDQLTRFSHAQIRQYLQLRLGPRKGDEAWKIIDGIYNLKSLADRPQLLDIIVDSLPELVAKGGAVSAGRLYQTYTNRWLDDPRIRPSERQSASEQLRVVLETLAVELWRREGQRIHHADLFALIMQRADLRGKLQVENLDVELRTAAFLSRTPEGYYGFSHRSFLEFFFARAIQRAFASTDGLAATLNNARLSSETAGFVYDLFDEESISIARQRVAALLGDPAAASAARVNAYLLAYELSLKGGTSTPTELAHAFTAQMAAWLPSSGPCLADGDLADAVLLFANFAGGDLSRCRLDRSHLWGADFSGARLVGASLFAADLAGARAEGADFSFVRADRAEAERLTLNGATLASSSWIGADLAEARLDGADFSGADLRAAHLARAVGKPKLKNASITGLTWADGGSPTQRRPARPRPVHPWGHTAAVTSVAFSNDGRRCLTGSDDHTARLWDADSGTALLTLQGHAGAVTSVAFSTDGRRCLTGSDDNTARLWHAGSGAALLTLQGHAGAVTSVAFSNDGRRCLTGSDDNTARLWDADSGATLLTLQGHVGPVNSVAFSADGSRCLTGSRDNNARLWEADSGATLLTLQGHAGEVTSVALSADGCRCLTGSRDNNARLWEADSGATLLTLQGHAGEVTSVAFSADGRRCLTGSDDNTARLWDADSGATLLQFPAFVVTSVAFSNDGHRCLTGSWDNTACLWDVYSGAALLTLRGHAAADASVAFSTNGRRCLVGRWDHARLWDTDSRAALLTLQWHASVVTSVALSADGRRCLTGSRDHASLWDADSGAALLTLQGHTGAVTSVAFSADGRRCLTGSRDNSARLWDVDSGAALLTLQGHAEGITSVAFSTDGSRCLTGSWDETARLWDADSGATLLTLQGHAAAVTSVAFSADGHRCLTGSWDQTARLWDADAGAALLTLKGHAAAVTSVAFSADGRRCLTGSRDNTARLWDARSGATLLTLQGHAGEVTSVAFSADGRRCLTGSRDDTARLWDADSGAALAWLWSDGSDWFWLDATQCDTQQVVTGSGPLLRSGGRGANRLKLADAAEDPRPWPWIPRQWPVADFPELVAK